MGRRCGAPLLALKLPLPLNHDTILGPGGPWLLDLAAKGRRVGVASLDIIQDFGRVDLLGLSDLFDDHSGSMYVI